MAVRNPDARLNVLLVESGRSVGGTERVVWELATRLPAARFAVRVWLSRAPGVDELARALAAAGVPVERLDEVDSRWDVAGMARTWWRLRHARADLLHVHHVWPAADRYLAALAQLAGVPCVVITEHIVGRSHSRGQRALKRRELARADAVTAVCAAVADTLVQDYGVPRDRLRVVANGAEAPDEAREAPAARAWRERFAASPARPLWAVVGRLEEQKGLDVLLAALAEVARRGLAFTLAVAGEGSCRAALERQAGSLGLAERVHFLGALDDAGALLAAADLVLLPSRWEGLPLVLLEALARARPVVASAVGGVPEVVADGIHGTLVPPGEPAPLADALERLHRQPDVALRLGRAGAARVHERFSWHAAVQGFEAVYDEALGLASVTPEPARAARGGGR